MYFKLYFELRAAEQFSGKASNKFATLLRLELFNYEYTARVYLESLSPLFAVSIFAYVYATVCAIFVSIVPTSRQTFYPIGCRYTPNMYAYMPK